MKNVKLMENINHHRHHFLNYDYLAKMQNDHEKYSKKKVL